MEGVQGVPALHGLKVLEIAQLIAGPMAGSLMADLGADVIHLEDPARGDPGRQLGIKKEGKNLWWKVSARNKRCVTLNLRSEEGRSIARRLARWADVVITNFRVGTLETWGLDWKSLHSENSKLIVLQISGYGANTTLRDRPGLGKVGEAMSGVVEITGWPDGPPVHTGFSHADTVTGLMGAFAVMAAAYRRRTDPDFDGEWIDLALFEPIYRLIEWQVITHDQLNIVPRRAGNQMAVTPAAVVNTYLSADDHWITVTSASVKAVCKIVAMLGEPVEEYDTADKQRDRSGQLDEMLRGWIRSVTREEALAALTDAEVVASKIYTMDDIVDDETYRERGDVISVDDQDFGTVRMQGVIPKLSKHPGSVWRSGPSVGEDNDFVYKKLLGMADDELDRLHADGVI
jgi:crotonobetainyl-CoA:carnitine CoA-transferase CaiB-like acyl-CoA transferase